MTEPGGPNQRAVTVVDLRDPAVAAAGMDHLDQDALSLQSGPLRAKRVIVRLESVSVVYQCVNRRVRTRTRVHEGLLAYATFGPRARGTVDGLQVRPGLMVVAEPGTDAGFVVEPGWESMTVLVPPGIIREHLAARKRKDEFRRPRGVELQRTDPVLAMDLFRLGRRLTATAARRPALFELDRTVRHAAQAEVLDSLLAATALTTRLEPLGTEKTRQAHSRIVKLAEDYALSHAGERVHVSDLCRATDVRERTLEYAFKQVMGLSPMAYLTRLRLHRVRARLLAAAPGSTKVSAEALAWGFWHFGEFSRAYRQCFGELPSVTLRRPSATAGH